MPYSNIIYIDTLIIINLYVSFFLIKACAVFLHKNIKTRRCVLSAATGGFSSLVILLPAFSVLLGGVIKLIIGAAIVLIAFGFEDYRTFLKNSLVFLIINIIFAGLMFLLQLFFSPLNMVYNNGIVYFDISFIALLIFTAAAYFLIKVLRYFLDVKFNADKAYNLHFEYKNKGFYLQAFADSGNTLTDFFSGNPVIICDKDALKGIFPEVPHIDNPDYITGGIRFLPFGTINGSGIIPVFKPDFVKIENKQVKALIGISKENIGKNGMNAVFNPKLLI